MHRATAVDQQHHQLLHWRYVINELYTTHDIITIIQKTSMMGDVIHTPPLASNCINESNLLAVTLGGTRSLETLDADRDNREVLLHASPH